MNNRIRLARFTFSLGAILGILGIGAAWIYGVSYSRQPDFLPTFFSIFLPLAALWSLFCYGAYRGLTSRKSILKFVFWFFVVFHFFCFPVGTAISGVSVWLWRDLKKNSAPSAAA